MLFSWRWSTSKHCISLVRAPMLHLWQSRLCSVSSFKADRLPLSASLTSFLSLIPAQSLFHFIIVIRCYFKHPFIVVFFLSCSSFFLRYFWAVLFFVFKQLWQRKFIDCVSNSHNLFAGPKFYINIHFCRIVVLNLNLLFSVTISI